MALTKVSNSMISGASVNVVDYGAVGDGTTDSTSAIQAAITAAGKGTVLFPDGVFKVSSPINVPVGCKIIGTYSLGQNANPNNTTPQGTKIVMSTASTSTTTITTPYGGALGQYYANVGSTVGISVGSLVKIAGAGWNGADYYGNVTVIGVNQVTLSTQWYTPVSSATMTIYSGQNIFNFAQPGIAYTLGNLIKGIWFNGGYNQISSIQGGVWVTISNCAFTDATNAGLYFGEFVQQYFLDNCEFVNNATGIYYYGSTGGAQCIFDKNKFYNLYFNGHKINCINISLPSGTGQGNEFYSIDYNYTTQDGIVFGGGISNTVFVGPSSESNGYINTTPLAPTTGAIVSGSNSLTVASATGLSINQTLTIQGAGSQGYDLQALITNIAGTTITLSANASTSVSGAEVVNYVYSDMKFTNNGTTPPYSFTFLGAALGFTSSVGAVLYGINAQGAAHSLFGYTGSRPINFGGSMAGVISNASSIRNTTVTNEQFTQNILADGVNFSRSQFVSPPGTNLVLGLQAANAGTATGFGQWQGYIANPNRTKVWSIDGTTGVASFSALAPGNGYAVGTTAAQRIFYSSGTPASTAPWNASAWIVGDRAFNSAPAVGSPKGWLCTVAGTPGTWVSEGNL
jgi:hypothetical protein